MSPGVPEGKLGHFQVAKELGRHKSAISRLAKKAREMGEEKAMVRIHVCGRKNLASLGDVRKILRLVQPRVSRGSWGRRGRISM